MGILTRRTQWTPHLTSALFFLILSLIVTQVSSTVCAVGCIPKGQRCVCGTKDGYPFSGHVICGKDGNSSKLRSVVTCLTPYNENESLIVAGACRPLTAIAEPEIVNLTIYFELPSTHEELNEKWCSPVSRTGTLCGQCINGTAINIHSVSYQCIPEHHCHSGLMWYLLGEIGPLTIALIVIFVFQPKLVTPSMNAFILFAQTVSLPNKLAGVGIGLSTTFQKPLTWPQYVFQAVYGMFNLQLSWVLFPKLCVGPARKFDMLTVLALQYVTALYPLAFGILLLISFELYHSNYRLIVHLCKPVMECLARCRLRFKLSTSPLDSLATLFLLSFIKITNVSIFILLYVPLYDINGTVKDFVLFYDGSVSAFGVHHLPYAILALVMLTVFTIAPTTILFLYYMRCFRWILFKFGFNSKVINAFADIYQAGYKNGTDGGCDCRFFAALYFIIRALFTFFMAMLDISTRFAFASIVVGIFMLSLFLIATPYKKTVHNVLDGIYFSYATVVITLYTYCEVLLSFAYAVESYRNAVLALNILLLAPAIFHPIFLLGLACHRRKIPSVLQKKLTGQFEESKMFERGRFYMDLREE